MTLKIRRLLIVTFGMLVAAALSAPADALDQDPLEFPNWVTRRDSVERQLGSAQPVRIENLYGDLRCRKAVGQTLEVTAVVQQLDNDPAQLQLELTEREDGSVELELSFYLGEAEPPHEEVASKRRVDLVLFVPEGSPLDLQTEAGRIAVKKLNNDLRARSASGAIEVSTRGELELSSASGELVASLGDTAWKKPVRLETVTGNITVYLPPNASVKATLETHGRFTTDFDLDFEPSAPGAGKRARAQAGDGQNALEVISDRGYLALLREPGS